MDLDRRHTIRETSHRILNPFTPEKLATLGDALFLPPGARVLDLASGKGELLCTWARDHGVSGVGVDISTVFVAAARARAEELGVSDRVRFEHADASSYRAADPVDVACCIGALGVVAWSLWVPSSPQAHWTVPAPNTRAPLGAR